MKIFIFSMIIFAVFCGALTFLCKCSGDTKGKTTKNQNDFYYDNEETNTNNQTSIDLDLDGDGISDYLDQDNDEDNDGIPDNWE